MSVKTKHQGRQPKKSKDAIREHFSSLGKKGGKAVFKKYGKEHFKKMAEARWDNEM